MNYFINNYMIFLNFLQSQNLILYNINSLNQSDVKEAKNFQFSIF